jgi:hypothetical protein
MKSSFPNRILSIFGGLRKMQLKVAIFNEMHWKLRQFMFNKNGSTCPSNLHLVPTNRFFLWRAQNEMDDYSTTRYTVTWRYHVTCLVKYPMGLDVTNASTRPNNFISYSSHEICLRPVVNNTQIILIRGRHHLRPSPDTTKVADRPSWLK